METVHSRRVRAPAPAIQAAMATAGGVPALALGAEVAGAQAAGR
jgi:hypothetical protein